METVVIVLMILVYFNFLLKQSYLNKIPMLISSLIAAIFVGYMWRYAIEQSKTQISDWLQNTNLMRDIAVILSVDVVIQFAFCILTARVITSDKLKSRTLKLYRFLHWFPGILIYPVLFSGLIWAIFSFPGHSFQTVAWIMATVVFVSIPLGSIFMTWLIPEKEVRLELLFLCNAMIGLLGVIATVNGQTAVVGVSEVNWSALVAILLLVVAGTLLGIGLRYWHLKRKYFI